MFTTWQIERARKPDVTAALRAIEAGRSPIRTDLEPLGAAWLYRHGFVAQRKSTDPKAPLMYDLTPEGKDLISALMAYNVTSLLKGMR